MIRAEQIPDAAAFALDDARKDPDALPWDLIAAALNAWPGSEYVYRQPHRRAVSYSKPAIILPLTENTNAE